MYQSNKKPIKGFIEQAYTIFKNLEDGDTLNSNEVSMSNKIYGQISVPDLSAGNWLGEFTFEIKSAEKPYKDFILTAQNLYMPNVQIEDGHLEIPEFFTYNNEKYRTVRIEDNAFYGRYELKSVVIPKSVSEIGKNAFFNCRTLSPAVFLCA
jgi:hypothetical protein